jgi:hypothetical protein
MTTKDVIAAAIRRKVYKAVVQVDLTPHPTHAVGGLAVTVTSPHFYRVAAADRTAWVYDALSQLDPAVLARVTDITCATPAAGVESH